METLPFGLLAILAGLGLVALGVWGSARASVKARSNGRQLAERLGLTLDPGEPLWGLFHPPPRARGVIRGKQVTIFTYTTGSGKSRVQWAAITIAPSGTGGLTFEIDRQGLLTKLAELFGSKEIQLGDPAFDARWFVRTNQPEFFRAAFLPELRAKLTALDAQGLLKGGISLREGVVKYKEQGSFHRQAVCERIAAVAEVACDFADVAEVWASRSA